MLFSTLLCHACPATPAGRGFAQRRADMAATGEDGPGGVGARYV